MHRETNRPKLHFTPQGGWMNDPNGLIFYRGMYHLYYQHDPDNLTPVSLHWGHAASKDLLHWKHLPTALYPDEHGQVYSGCMVQDAGNSSGFFDAGEGGLVACFTQHLEGKNSYSQSQSLAYSNSGGQSFCKFTENPVLTYEKKDFRDPMVFWHQGHWVMLLVAGRSVRFYTSMNLKQWKFASVFEPPCPPQDESELWECPCLRQLYDEKGEGYWVLLVSVITTEADCTFGMHYYIGRFDGSTFTAGHGPPRRLDAGWDFYAGAFYANEKKRALLMAWMGCWYYARQLPEKGWRGAMAFPRELGIQNGPGGPRLSQRFARELESVLAPAETFREVSVLRLDAACVQLKLCLRPEDNRLRIFCGERVCLQIEIDAAAHRVSLQREGERMPQRYRREFYVEDIAQAPVWEWKLLLDVTSAELLLDDGVGACTLLLPGVGEYGRLEAERPCKRIDRQRLR